MHDSDRHGHIVPLSSGKLARCDGLGLGCAVCAAELAELGIEANEYFAARRAGLARVLAALIRVCARDHTPEEKRGILAELFSAGASAAPVGNRPRFASAIAQRFDASSSRAY